MCWLIFACHKGYGGVINRILSWEAFGPLAKLSFGVYLLHLSVAVFVISYMTFDYAISHIFVVSHQHMHNFLLLLTLLIFFQSVLAITVYWISSIIAVPMFVFLEVPLVVLEKLLFKFIFGMVAKVSGKKDK